MLRRTPKGEYSSRASPMAEWIFFGARKHSALFAKCRMIEALSSASPRLSAILLPISNVARRASSSFFSRSSWADLPITFERSLNGHAAHGRNARSAVVTASHICSSVCSVKVLKTSPVAGFTLRYDILGSLCLPKSWSTGYQGQAALVDGNCCFDREDCKTGATLKTDLPCR